MASFALEHLTFTYPGQTRPALSDLTLTIPEGRSRSSAARAAAGNPPSCASSRPASRRTALSAARCALGTRS